MQYNFVYLESNIEGRILKYLPLIACNFNQKLQNNAYLRKKIRIKN